MIQDWKTVMYFKPEEFDSPDQPGSGAIQMHHELVRKLDEARGRAGIPFKINSAYRSPDHNAAVGGRPKSAHMTGEAVDIAARNPATRLKILIALLAAGFTRLEITPWHIHVDVAKDDVHPQDILLVLDTKTGNLV